ncbi:hypothetical protein LXL04_005240 [Taraxacum kok-saghyz]
MFGVGITGNDDSFLVRSARTHIDLALLPSSGLLVRWCKYLPRKVNVLLWRLQHKRLPTRCALSNRGITIDNIMCALCDAVPEQVKKELCRCSWT